MKGFERVNDSSSTAYTKTLDIFEIASGTTLKSAGTFSFTGSGGAASANSLLMGVGTSASPATTAVASKVFMEFRTQSSATSGDSRCLYMRHDLSGAAGGGEALRAFTKVSAACSTARGAHISLDMAAAGTLSGFGAGIDSQLMLGGAGYSGTLTALNLELYGNASAQVSVAGGTSFLRCNIGGDSTAVTNISTNGAFLSLANAAGSGLMLDSDITALTGKAALRVYVAGSLYGYIPVVSGS